MSEDREMEKRRRQERRNRDRTRTARFCDEEEAMFACYGGPAKEVPTSK